MTNRKSVFSNMECPTLILTIILLLVIGGCENETSDIVEEQKIWERYEPINSEIGLMNSANRNGHLNAWSGGLFIKNIALSSIDTDLNIFHTGTYVGAGRLKFPIAQNYYVFTDFSKVNIRSALSTESQSVEKIIELESLDSNFIELIDIPYWQGECMAISENGFLLIPYWAAQSNTPYFVLVEISSPESEDRQLEIESVKLINQDIFPGIVNLYHIQTFFDRFFLLMGERTYRIDTEGHIDLILEKTLNIFQIGDDLFAFAPNYNSELVDLYKSIDRGESWVFFGEIDEEVLVDLQYVTIHNKVVGYGKGQIFELEITDNNYSITELDNEGLGLADITSISLNDDDMVFITTRCNSFSVTCGAYYKPLEFFFDKKRIE